MKRVLGFVIMLFTVASCQKNEVTSVENSAEKSNLVSTSTINQTIYDILETTAVFDWKMVDDHTLYSAAMQSDGVFEIGYQPAGFQNLSERIHEIDIHSKEWKAIQYQILTLILDGEKALNPKVKLDDLLAVGYPKVLPNMAVLISNEKTITKLRNLPEVRFLEAMGYALPSRNVESRNIFGCNGAGPNFDIDENDYTTIAPDVKQSWHHEASKITQAWEHSTGEGITIVVLDTGLSDDQENLGDSFNSGLSENRTVERLSTHYTGILWWKELDAPHDQCGHGTEMSGIAAAPRGNDGNSVGVAYNANLIGIRAVNDVVIDGSNDKDGVKDALVYAGDRDDVKVISMSVGSPLSSGTVEDGIYYAYNKDKMICAAAGTSLNITTNLVNVIFPANMSQTVAVTGVKDKFPLERCSTCHDGSQVDFVIPTEKVGDSDNGPITLSSYSDIPNYSGGSSPSVSSVAGIAALVWAAHPRLSRANIYKLMYENSSNFPNRDNNLGWGIIDAEAAVKVGILYNDEPNGF
jgi:serine protease